MNNKTIAAQDLLINREVVLNKLTTELCKKYERDLNSGENVAEALRYFTRKFLDEGDTEGLVKIAKAGTVFIRSLINQIKHGPSLREEHMQLAEVLPVYIDLLSTVSKEDVPGAINMVELKKMKSIIDESPHHAQTFLGILAVEYGFDDIKMVGHMIFLSNGFTVNVPSLYVHPLRYSDLETIVNPLKLDDKRVAANRIMKVGAMDLITDFKGTKLEYECAPWMYYALINIAAKYDIPKVRLYKEGFVRKSIFAELEHGEKKITVEIPNYHSKSLHEPFIRIITDAIEGK